ncbi:MAG: helix-turn-helix transcriptional regulator [Burkholderiales bacterium]|nr:helix-turn-helix transcriptional regulator [Burkholderiales bacterium]
MEANLNEEPWGHSLATRLRWCREARGILSQARLAKLAGVSVGAIGNYEAGKRHNPRNLLPIAEALKCDPTWLQEGRGMPFGTINEEPRALTARSRRIAEMLDDFGPPDSEDFLRAYTAVREALDEVASNKVHPKHSRTNRS